MLGSFGAPLREAKFFSRAPTKILCAGFRLARLILQITNNFGRLIDKIERRLATVISSPVGPCPREIQDFLAIFTLLFLVRVSDLGAFSKPVRERHFALLKKY
jgi:hypothetical protein